MIVSRLEGGLGNQMFQYAAAYSLASDKGCSVDLDLSWFKTQKATTVRSFELGIFGVEPKLNEKKTNFYKSLFDSLIETLRKAISRSSIQTVNEPHFHYWSGFHELSDTSILVGYWQSEKYFLHNRNTILDVFTFPDITEAHNVTYANHIKGKFNSVSLHVRRGDYISDANTNAFHGCCSMEYYDQAIANLESHLDDTHYFIFSDDPDWVKETFKLNNMTIVTGNNGSLSFRDMQLMSLCKHHIIANSSFSWWGAWLSKDTGLTIAPKKWFLDPSNDTRDIYAQSWKLI